MNRNILTVLVLAFALAAPMVAQTVSTGSCVDYTLSATGRVQVLANTGAAFTAAHFSYFTTGTPTGVSITVEAGNKPVATQTPFTKIAAVTNTTGADMGSASGAYKFWWVNLGTLTAGTAPTVVVTACFSPNPWERFTTSGATPVDVLFIGGAAVPATTISTATGAKAENVANWIHTLSAISGQDLAAGAGSQQAPVGVVAPNATHDERLVNRLKTHAIIAALDTTMVAGTQEVPISAVKSGNALPENSNDALKIVAQIAAIDTTQVVGTKQVPLYTGVAPNTLAIDHAVMPSLAAIVAASCDGAHPGTAYDVSKLGPSFHTVTFNTGAALAACTAQLEGSLDNSKWYSLTGDIDCTAVTGAMIHAPEKPVNYVRGNCTALTAANTVTISYLGVR